MDDDDDDCRAGFDSRKKPYLASYGAGLRQVGNVSDHAFYQKKKNAIQVWLR